MGRARNGTRGGASFLRAGMRAGRVLRRALFTASGRPVRMPDGLPAPLRGRQELRILRELAEERRRIARRRLLEIAALVARDLDQDAIRDHGARLLFRDVAGAGELVAVLDEEPPRAALSSAGPHPHEDPGASKLLPLAWQLEV